MATPVAIYRQEGDQIDYTPGAAVAAGDVIDFGTWFGIAQVDIAANALGAVAIEGVFEVQKNAGEAIAMGVRVNFNVSTKLAGALSGYDGILGVCVKAALAGDSTVWVKLTPGVS